MRQKNQYLNDVTTAIKVFVGMIMNNKQEKGKSVLKFVTSFWDNLLPINEEASTNVRLRRQLGIVAGFHQGSKSPNLEQTEVHSSTPVVFVT